MQVSQTVHQIGSRIFRSGSITYYYSSLFFPKTVRRDVFLFYAFVRTADDFVDQLPQDRRGFARFRAETEVALSHEQAPSDPVIQGLMAVVDQYEIPSDWIMAFLDAMEADLTTDTYERFSDLEQYMYGSAEVIGLVMARIMQLPVESYQTAQLQGKAMQLINFIRDIQEDISLRRQYIPSEDLKQFGIDRLDEPEIASTAKFAQLVRFEVARYYALQEQAAQGYAFLPRSYRIPVQTAASMYQWTADQIRTNPAIIFDRKVKPHPLQVIRSAITHSIRS
jgi:phytoene synthase